MAHYEFPTILILSHYDVHCLDERHQRKRTLPKFSQPVVTYQSNGLTYVKIEEFDQNRHGNFDDLYAAFAACWINADDETRILSEEFTRDDFVQTSVSYTKTGDIQTAAYHLNSAKKIHSARGSNSKTE